eukprot:TRINITY_DN846_c0_g1_i1.p2 TRINITY_DN846_c0_g1~~TRINITY_DN846_c0_g1_i1.p2  ORF type:complete len:168 (+),score=63.20 TRINITY_DN846_c0_g1_i1:162-665(+)
MQQLCGVVVFTARGDVLMQQQEHADGEKHWYPPKGFVAPEEKARWARRDLPLAERHQMALRHARVKAAAVALRAGWRKTWTYMTGCGMKRVVYYAGVAAAEAPGDIFLGDPKRPKKPTFEWMDVPTALKRCKHDAIKALILEAQVWALCGEKLPPAEHDPSRGAKTT